MDINIAELNRTLEALERRVIDVALLSAAPAVSEARPIDARSDGLAEAAQHFFEREFYACRAEGVYRNDRRVLRIMLLWGWRLDDPRVRAQAAVCAGGELAWNRAEADWRDAQGYLSYVQEGLGMLDAGWPASV